MCRYIGTKEIICMCRLKESGTKDVFMEKFTREIDSEAGRCGSLREKLTMKLEDVVVYRKNGRYKERIT